MKRIFLFAVAFVLAAVMIGYSYYAYYSFYGAPAADEPVAGGSAVEKSDRTAGEPQRASRVEIVTRDLDIPWEVAFLPDGGILVTERGGALKKLGEGGFRIQVPGVAAIGEGGLLGMALHPDHAANRWIYLYHTARTDGAVSNVVERYVLAGGGLSDRKIIIGNIPASANHNGGRIAFGPDGFLYVTTGDAQNGVDAQNKNSLAGKILRLKDDGGIPEDNPFGNAAYSYGHRNVQGIAWDGEGWLWATEHGRSGALSGYDELNLVKKGANYGWPDIQGDGRKTGMETPVIHSGPNDTWAPSGAAYSDGSIFFAGLRGQALYEYEMNDDRLSAHLKGRFGRLRAVAVGPDGNFYVLTNNTDGRGAPKSGDDKLIKISPDLLK